jgi:polyisoprenoid-binding protein YceI
VRSTILPIWMTGLLAVALAACGGAAQSVGEPTVTAEPTPETAQPPEMIDPSASQAGAPESDGLLVFEILGEGTQARFIINEVLNGTPNTVVGVTSAVRGEIRVNVDDPGQTSLGAIEVEAGSLTTDSNFRNGAIRSFILATGEYPVVTFLPQAVTGLPAEVSVGDTFSFEVAGDLTVRDVSQPVTFGVTVTVESLDRLTGSASAQILRSDFGLTIPSVPQVASVEDLASLELDFAAGRAQ